MKLPAWAKFGRPWGDGGFLLIAPLYSDNGRLHSVRARLAFLDGPRKEVAPAGHEAVGLVMADALGRRLLRGEAEAVTIVTRVGVIVAEGTPNWLSYAAMAWADGDEDAPAVLGIFSGAWNEALAARIPDGAPVTIDTDADGPGDRYAERVFETLRARCVLRRVERGVEA